ncbi:hypothetical protein [Helcococcus kunzii]|uniref:hypothetical protein n=1 Tax=Helcococcus kunzii TaxID=40091 RepID=UPI00389E791D
MFYPWMWEEYLQEQADFAEERLEELKNKKELTNDDIEELKNINLILMDAGREAINEKNFTL